MESKGESMRRLPSLTFAAAAALVVGLFPGVSIVAGDAHAHIECGYSRNLCAEVDDTEAFAYYVGHDEPSLLFYSDHPGSGNRMQYVLTLPSDPAVPASGVPNPGQSFNFELHPAFWFGMAICDTQSSPRPLGDPAKPINPGLPCIPDSDTNIHENPDPAAPVTLPDPASGLRIDLNDLTTGETGFMTASAANGFGQVQYEPSGAVCKNLPYDFHPEYSTSSELTRVPWAAHSYNIAFSDEIGHFDFCGHVSKSGGCNAREGAAGDIEKTDADDNFCFD